MKTLLAALLTLIPLTATAADWPQWMGPKRDGHSPEKGLLKVWPKAGPALAWQINTLGAGYSSPAVVGDKIYILGTRNGDEYLFCLNAGNGAGVWNVKLEPTFNFKGNQWGEGPRATPTVADGLVYALGGSGQLVCVDAARGNVVWQTHMINNLKGAVNNIGGSPKPLGWGYSWSPLLDGAQLICFPGGPGGAAAALNPKTGAVLWRSKDFKDEASYASPVVAEFAGVRQYVFLHNAGLTGVDAKNGNTLWTWAKNYGDVIIPTPLIFKDHVFVSAGYRPASGELVQITKAANNFVAAPVFAVGARRVMKNTVAGSVIVDGHAYGYSDKSGWTCQDLAAPNKAVWSERNGLGVGSVIYADGRLYCYDEDNGEVALLEASPKGYTECGRFALPRAAAAKAPSARNWTPPVIANGYLFIRDQELLFCFKI